jgi:hypothetical protein
MPDRGAIGYSGPFTQGISCHSKEGNVAVKQPFLGCGFVVMALRHSSCLLNSSAGRRGITLVAAAGRGLAFAAALAGFASGISTKNRARPVVMKLKIFAGKLEFILTSHDNELVPDRGFNRTSPTALHGIYVTAPRKSICHW